MSVRDKLFEKLAQRSRSITAIISIISLYFLSTLPAISDRTNVSEDTMSPGRTPPFIEAQDLVQAAIGDMPANITGIGLPYLHFTTSRGNRIDYTFVQSKRADSREAVVVGVQLSQTESGTQGVSGSAVALTVAKSLTRVQWLARDIYFVFIPDSCRSFSFGLREWLSDFYFSNHQSLMRERPLIRAAFALDLGSGVGIPFMEYEGINGIAPDQDIANLMSEVADELRIPMRVRPVFESVAYQSLNGGVHSPHSAFLDKAIPAITLTTEKEGKQQVTLQQLCQLVGKYLRALQALHHQLHHSTSIFLFTGYRQDVSLGKLIPLMLGAICPLFVSAVAPDHNNAPTAVLSGLVGFVLSAFLIVGGAAFWSLLSLSGFPVSTCTFPVKPTDTISTSAVACIGIACLLHVLASKYLGRNASYDHGHELRSAAFKVTAIVMTVVMLFHWSAAVVVGALVVPVVIAAVPLRDGRIYILRRVVGILTLVFSVSVFTCMVSGFEVPVSIRGAVIQGIDFLTAHARSIADPTKAPLELLAFLRSLVGNGTRKSLSTLVQEFQCVKGLALPLYCFAILPGLILGVEIMLAEPSRCVSKVTETHKEGSRVDLRRKLALAAIVLVVGLYIGDFIPG
jgi:hypothetical protein